MAEAKGVKTKPFAIEDLSKRAYPMFENGEVSPGIVVSDDGVTFTGQRGPIKEVGVNGCQIDDMIEFAKIVVEGFNAHFPCSENKYVADELFKALHCVTLAQDAPS